MGLHHLFPRYGSMMAQAQDLSTTFLGSSQDHVKQLMTGTPSIGWWLRSGVHSANGGPIHHQTDKV